MLLLELFENWDHYTEFGHEKGSLLYYVMPGGKIVTDEVRGRAYHKEEPESKALAVGRIDPVAKKISVRPPLAPGNMWYMIPEAKLEYIRKRLERAYPDYEIWYFGNSAKEIRRIDSMA